MIERQLLKLQDDDDDDDDDGTMVVTIQMLMKYQDFSFY